MEHFGGICKQWLVKLEEKSPKKLDVFIPEVFNHS